MPRREKKIALIFLQSNIFSLDSLILHVFTHKQYVSAIRPLFMCENIAIFFSLLGINGFSVKNWFYPIAKLAHPTMYNDNMTL